MKVLRVIENEVEKVEDEMEDEMERNRNSGIHHELDEVEEPEDKAPLINGVRNRFFIPIFMSCYVFIHCFRYSDRFYKRKDSHVTNVILIIIILFIEFESGYKTCA
jgi:hypothetical protein